MHSVTEVTISCSENSFFGMVIGLFPVKPDINWFCSSTVVDGGISNKACLVGRGSLFSRQETQMREPLLAGKPEVKICLFTIIVFVLKTVFCFFEFILTPEVSAFTNKCMPLSAMCLLLSSNYLVHCFKIMILQQ